MSDKKQLAINLIASLAVFAVNLFVSFFLSPYIVRTIGVEANGFIQLANNFVSYANIITTALNSMAGRFITIEFYGGSTEKANTYYTSVFFGNLFLAILLVIPTTLFVLNINKIVEVPAYLLTDVKLLFTFVFANFFIGLVFPIWSVCYFSTNKLYLSSIINIICSIVRFIIIGSMFMIFRPSVWYLGLASLSVSVISIAWAFYNKKMLLSQLRIKRTYLKFKALVELVSAGIWNSITSAGTLLLLSVDLLVGNLIFGATEMGLLSLSKIFPSTMSVLSGALISIFAPQLTINYAQGNIGAIVKDLKRGAKLTGIVMTIPMAVFMVFGKDFFALWVPSENARQLQLLSVLSCFGFIFTAGTQVLYNVFSAINKLRGNSLALIISGVGGLLFSVILSRFTPLGLYGIPFATGVAALLKNLIYVVPYAAKHLGYPRKTFFTEVFYSALSIVIIFAVGSAVNYLVDINSWGSLIIVCALVSMLGFGINLMIVLNKNERQYFYNLIKSRVRRESK